MFARPALLCRVLFAAAALVASATSALADSLVYQQLLDASVWIVNPTAGGTGSGIVVDAERRLVVTNYHVVGESRKVVLFFAAFDGEGSLVTDKSTYIDNFETLESEQLACVGKVVGTWKERDLALIELETLPADVPAITLAETGAQPGENVHSVGNPSASGSLWVYSPGNVRQVYRRLTEFQSGQQVSARVLEVTSPINPGDSGSGMVNSAGELIGIVSSMSHAGRMMSHAIDITEVKAFLQSYGADPSTIASTNEGQMMPTGKVFAGNTTQVRWPQ